jgi:methionyl-tRNA formyltransferase
MSSSKARLIILASDCAWRLLSSLAEACGVNATPMHARDEADLVALVANVDQEDMLLSHSTSVIVPGKLLERFGERALNIHAASPDYPGRDPHHFAAYDGVRRYGATLHRMTRKVDAGEILDVEWFDVPIKALPAQLLRDANDAAARLARRLFERLATGASVHSPLTLQWGARKTTRADFLALCRLDPAMSRDEAERRMRAVSVPGRKNAWVELWGRRFVLDEEAA